MIRLTPKQELPPSWWRGLATPPDRAGSTKLLKLRRRLPSVTHHKKQEATTELHSESAFLSFLSGHYHPSLPSHLASFLTPPKNSPTFCPTHFHCLLLIVESSADCAVHPPPPLPLGHHRFIPTLHQPTAPQPQTFTLSQLCQRPFFSTARVRFWGLASPAAAAPSSNPTTVLMLAARLTVGNSR